MAAFKSLAKQTAIYGVSSIVGRLLNYFLTPFYTNLFSTSQYGIVSNLYAYISFFNVILTYGMETAFFRFSNTEKDTNKVFTTILTSIIATSSIFLVFCYLFNQSIANWMSYGDHPEYIKWFALISAADAITAIGFAKLRQKNVAIRFVFIRMSNILFNIFLNLFFLLICPFLAAKDIHIFDSIYNPNIGIGYIFISNVISSLFTFVLLIPDLFFTKFKFDIELLKPILRYAFPLLIVGLAGMVNETMDRIFLKWWTPVPEGLPNAAHYIDGQIGVYGANYKLAIFMTLFIQTFRYAAEPFFFSKKQDKDSKQIYADVMKYFIIFCLIIFLGVTFNLDWLKHFVGRRFRSGVTIVPILLLANLFLGVIFNLSFWYKLSNQTKYGTYITMYGAAITIFLNFILIPRFGYLGAAWATFLCYFGMAVISYFWGQKHYHIDYQMKRIAGYFALAMALFFVFKLIDSHYILFNLFFGNLFLILFVMVAIKTEDLYDIIRLNMNVILKKIIK